jgi:hypothetical protein
MPQPTFSDVHISAALTNISVAYYQDQDAYIADKVFPMVPVLHQTDQYFVWSKDDFFRDEAQARADATESAGSGFNLKTQSYSAQVYALHKDIGPQVRANCDPAIDIDVVTTKTLMQKLMIRRDRIFAQDFLTTTLWSQDVTGTAGGTPGSTTPAYWNDDANGDPFTDISTWQTYILQNTGYEPNRLVIAYPVYQALRKHPLVIDRIKYTSQPDAKDVTAQMLADMFDVDECIVSRAVYNSAAEGLTGSYSFVIGKVALLCYAADEPGLMVPSAGYIFGWQGFTGLNNLGIRTNQIPMNWLGMGMVRDECEMAFDMDIVGKDLGVFFSGIVQ